MDCGPIEMLEGTRKALQKEIEDVWEHIGQHPSFLDQHYARLRALDLQLGCIVDRLKDRQKVDLAEGESVFCLTAHAVVPMVLRIRAKSSTEAVNRAKQCALDLTYPRPDPFTALGLWQVDQHASHLVQIGVQEMRLIAEVKDEQGRCAGPLAGKEGSNG